MPFSDPPKKPTNWWKSLPGQLAILVIVAGAVAIIWAVFVIGPDGAR